MKTHIISPIYCNPAKPISKNEEFKLGFDEQKRTEKEIKDRNKKIKKRGHKKPTISKEDAEKIAYKTWKEWGVNQSKEYVLAIEKYLKLHDDACWEKFKSMIQGGSNPTRALLRVLNDYKN
ncbi:MAG: hypothetical protein K9J78_06280 [Polynucleobacter sp.]|nr:hypothetical protein [Polynucleobacter sp.]